MWENKMQFSLLGPISAYFGVHLSHLILHLNRYWTHEIKTLVENWSAYFLLSIVVLINKEEFCDVMVNICLCAVFILVHCQIYSVVMLWMENKSLSKLHHVWVHLAIQLSRSFFSQPLQNKLICINIHAICTSNSLIYWWKTNKNLFLLIRIWDGLQNMGNNMQGLFFHIFPWHDLR